MKKIVWNCIYPNPPCISRDKYYTYESNGDIVTVNADGCKIEYTVKQLHEFFKPEVGTWEELGKKERIETRISKPTSK